VTNMNERAMAYVWGWYMVLLVVRGLG